MTSARPVNETIETERCSLVRLDMLDRQDVAALYQDEDVRLHLGGPLCGEPFEERFAGLLGESDARYWAIRGRTAGDFIGLVGLSRHHDGHDVEVSYQMLPAFWGAGFALEAVGAVMRHAFGALGLPRVVAETQAANLQSRRLLERLGMAATRRVVRFGAAQIIYERGSDP